MKQGEAPLCDAPIFPQIDQALPSFPVTNGLAYFVSPSAKKKKVFCPKPQAERKSVWGLHIFDERFK